MRTFLSNPWSVLIRRFSSRRAFLATIASSRTARAASLILRCFCSIFSICVLAASPRS